MFKRLVDTSRLNDDERDTTEVPKQALNVLLDYLFNFYHGVKLAFTKFD